MDEKPLWVQLFWGKDQREGRFVLQNARLPKVSFIIPIQLNPILVSALKDVKTYWR